MKFIVAEAQEGDGTNWQPATPEERCRATAILAEKEKGVRVLDINVLPSAYQGFTDPQGYLGSKPPPH